VISEFLRSLGPWCNHIVIGGGYALIIYKLYLADKQLKNSPVGTRDIDSLIPRRVPGASKINIVRHLYEDGLPAKVIKLKRKNCKTKGINFVKNPKWIMSHPANTLSEPLPDRRAASQT
jgi:hypothetical protein